MNQMKNAINFHKIDGDIIPFFALKTIPYLMFKLLSNEVIKYIRCAHLRTLM